MNRLTRILELSRQDNWYGSIPEVDISLKIAIDALHRQQRGFWNLSTEDFEVLLETNPGVARQFNRLDERTIAFAIRSKRLNQKNTSP